MPYELDEELGCHVWTGRVLCGVPVIRDRHGFATVRRRTWEREHGKPVPDGLVVITICGTALCVLGRHLEAVDWAERNYRQGWSKLDPKRAARALLMRDRGVSRRRVAETFNVDPATIRNIERGEHWTQRKAAA